jgi:hypothetical protein
MKSLSNQEVLKIKQALSKAYFKKKYGKLSDHWKAEVMKQIKTQTCNPLKMKYVDQFQQLVWRLSPIMCILILLLSAIISVVDFFPDYQKAEIRFETPIDLELFPAIVNK